jgi:hypothetical protein
VIGVTIVSTSTFGGMNFFLLVGGLDAVRQVYDD